MLSKLLQCQLTIFKVINNTYFIQNNFNNGSSSIIIYIKLQSNHYESLQFKKTPSIPNRILNKEISTPKKRQNDQILTNNSHKKRNITPINLNETELKKNKAAERQREYRAQKIAENNKKQLNNNIQIDNISEPGLANNAIVSFIKSLLKLAH